MSLQETLYLYFLKKHLDYEGILCKYYFEYI